MNTLKLTHYDQEVFVVLNNVTHIKKETTSLGHTAMAVHFNNKESIIVEESLEEIEKMLEEISSKMSPQKKTHLGFDYR